jgi:hypothetical protein
LRKDVDLEGGGRGNVQLSERVRKQRGYDMIQLRVSTWDKTM